MTVKPAEAAGIYTRLSLARFGDTTKVDEQERQCRELCARRGWDVAATYTDNNRSAWQRDRKRPGWDAMLEDVGRGRLTAIVVYHGDRLVRQPFDLEQLLNLAYGRGIKLASPTGTRDLGNEDDLFILRIEVAAQCRESAATSRRKKAGFARMARDGRAPVPGGRFGRGFGYEADGRTHHPVEAAAIREAATLVLDGERLTTVCRMLTARGVTSVSGDPLTYQSLKRILMRPRIAGLLGDGKTPGNWEPILDRSEWELVCGILDGRKPHHGGAAKYLLSGIATCWACGKPVQRQSAAGTLGYGCVTPGCHKVHRNMDLLDAYIAGRVVRRLGNPRNPAGQVPAAPGVAAQIGALEAARAELAARVTNPDEPHLDLLLARLDAIDERINNVREQAGGAARAQLIARHLGISLNDFFTLPLATKRALITAMFRIRILPASRRGPGFSSDDVEVTPL